MAGMRTRATGGRPTRRLVVAKRKAQHYIQKIRAAPDGMISPQRKGELLLAMAKLIAGVEEDPKMRQRFMQMLMQDPEDPVVKFLREQGKAEGALGAIRSAVLQVLECRFGRPSRDLVEQINSISSLKKLKALHRRAALAPRIEDFLKSLK